MIRSWLAYLLLLLLDALAWISIDGYLYYLLLRVLLMLPLLSLLLFIAGNRFLKLQLKTSKKGCVIHMPTSLPLLVCSGIRIQGSWKNCFYESSETISLEVKHREQKLQIPKLGSGKYELQLNSIQTRDLLGLFRKTQSWDKEVTTLFPTALYGVTQVQYTNLLQEARQSSPVFSAVIADEGAP